VVSTCSITVQSLGKIVQHAPAVGAKMWCLYVLTGRMPQSGKLPVVNLLTGQKSGFSPRRATRSLRRFTSSLVGPTGTWVRLAVQNFTSIGAGGGNAAPKYEKFPLFGKDSPRTGEPFDRFLNFYGLLNAQLSCISTSNLT